MPNIESVMDNVRRILSWHTETRNSDLALLLTYWQEVDKIKIEFPTSKMKFATKPETIIRCRRHIQNTDKCLLPTSSKVLDARNLREEIFRAEMPKFKDQDDTAQRFIY